MPHRHPPLKAQAKQLRAVFQDRGVALSQGEALEFVSRLNGYPSWNVARHAPETAGSAGPQESRVAFTVWAGIHRHRHGEDVYLFSSCPSKQDIIDAVNAGSSFEPQFDESVEVVGSETFTVDAPLLVQQHLAAELRRTGLTGVHEVCMTDLVEYDTPDAVPEWSWVREHSSFAHNGNGVEPSVWEFLVPVNRVREQEVPPLLRPDVQKAMDLGAAWLLFHQG